MTWRSMLLRKRGRYRPARRDGGERNGSAVVARGISGANIKVKASLTFPQWLQLINPSSVEAD
jgi:hypothetical protein